MKTDFEVMIEKAAIARHAMDEARESVIYFQKVRGIKRPNIRDLPAGEVLRLIDTYQKARCDPREFTGEDFTEEENASPKAHS